MPNPLDEFSGAPLSEIENKKMRRLIRDQERRDWLARSVMIHGSYSIAFVGGLYAGRDKIAAIWKVIFQ